MTTDYEIAKELLEDFIAAIPEESIKFIYNEYSINLKKKGMPNHRVPSLKVFKTKDIKFVIFNKMCKTEFKHLFASLTNIELAKLLNITNKEFTAIHHIAIKKLKAGLIKNQKNQLEESFDTVKELYWNYSKEHTVIEEYNHSFTTIDYDISISEQDDGYDLDNAIKDNK